MSKNKRNLQIGLFSFTKFYFFLAKLGGWLGVVMGGSLVGMSEMVVYIFCFAYKAYKGKTEWP